MKLKKFPGTTEFAQIRITSVTDDMSQVYIFNIGQPLIDFAETVH